MYILQSIENEDNVHFLYGGSKLLVSRIKGHVVLPQDKSVSREHANLSISHDINDLDNCANHPQIFIEDLGSRYGTFLNEGIEAGNKLEPHTLHQLQVGDTIRFGLLENVWKVTHRQIVACSSLVENLSEVKTALHRLGGHLLRDWTVDCNILVMKDLFLTAKAVCALSSCSNIVTPNYLVNLMASVQNKTNHPVPLRFQPPLKEICIGKDNVSFVPDAKRKSLFKGKHFIFCSLKSLKKLKSAVLLSGGTTDLLSNKNVHSLSLDNNILINQPDVKTKRNEFLDTANEILQKNSLNSVPESDIGLAILHISIDKYCNPQFKVNNLLCRQKGFEIHPTQNLEIYATETQYDEIPIQSVIYPASRTVIMETGQSTRATTSAVTSGRSRSSLPNPILSLPNQLPSLPPFPLKDGFTEETCMSTQTQWLRVSPTKLGKQANKRERLSSDEGSSPVTKKRNVGLKEGAHLPEMLEIDASSQQQTEKSDVLTQPFNPPYCSSMQDEILFQLSCDIPKFSAASEDIRDTKPPVGVNGDDVTNVFKSPDARKRKQSPSHCVLTETQIKRAKSNDEPKSVGVSSDIDCNPFALPCSRSRRQRRVLQPTNDQNLISHSPLIEAESLPQESVDKSPTINRRSPAVKVEEPQPFTVTQIKTEEKGIKEDVSRPESEKSMMVVEVVSLVKHPFSRLSLQEPSNVLSFTGRNFKRFKKVSHGSCSAITIALPRIIGGQDLVISIDDNPQKELFLASQEPEPAAIAQPMAARNNQLIENEFSLPIPIKRSRVRVR